MFAGSVTHVLDWRGCRLADWILVQQRLHQAGVVWTERKKRRNSKVKGRIVHSQSQRQGVHAASQSKRQRIHSGQTWSASSSTTHLRSLVNKSLQLANTNRNWSDFKTICLWWYCCCCCWKTRFRKGFKQLRKVISRGMLRKVSSKRRFRRACS